MSRAKPELGKLARRAELTVGIGYFTAPIRRTFGEHRTKVEVP